MLTTRISGPARNALISKPTRPSAPLHAMFARLFIDNDIFCQRLESLTVCLDYCDGKMTSFAGVDVSNRAVFAFVCAADHLAFSTILYLAWLFGFHGFSLLGMDRLSRSILNPVSHLEMIETANIPVIPTQFEVSALQESG
ncbi:MAG: hypothetical protein H7Z17_12385 [Fuerstia sp.]|nr:hypothetical protein [Fuerstiella sp.]